MSSEYTHGHHESVLRSHTWRTVANSAAYLVPHLKSTFSILDVGCGPGTITLDFAKNYVPEGEVTALEYVEEPLRIVEKSASERGINNIKFVVGDIHALPFEDETFDVVHAHQVLQHIHDPEQALKEMLRVAKKGGIVAARDADFDGFMWYPNVDGMDQWKSLYQKVARGNGGEPNMGRQIHAIAMKAGYQKSKMELSIGNWCYANDTEVKWWSGLWADRTLASNFAESALKHGNASKDELQKASGAWKKWGEQRDAWFGVPHGEMIYHK